MAKQISDLDRNDISAALELAEERLDAGTYTADDGQMLAMLQDDPAELAQEFDAMIEHRIVDGLSIEVVSPEADHS